MLFIHFSELVLLLGVKCLKFFKIFQFVFNQDVPLQPIFPPSPQINDLKHRDSMSWWQIPITSYDMVKEEG